MSAYPLPYRLRLFTLRLWQEVVNGDLWEWRGEVKNTSTGEIRYFRDFQVLSELLPLLLSEPDEELLNPQDDGETVQNQKERAVATAIEIFEAGVHSTNRNVEAAFASGDAALAAAAYTIRGQAFPPNATTVSGRAALQSFWQGLMQSGVKNVSLETIELVQCGDLAYEVGLATLYGEGGIVLEIAKFMVIWQEEFGRWKWHRDIWNSNLPA